MNFVQSLAAMLFRDLKTYNILVGTLHTSSEAPLSLSSIVIKLAKWIVPKHFLNRNH